MLREAADDITAFADFPAAHWKKIWSTNPLEQVNKEVKRRTHVVGVFPNPEAPHRLAGCILIEIHDEWQIAERRYLSESSMALIANTTNQEEAAKQDLSRQAAPSPWSRWKGRYGFAPTSVKPTTGWTSVEFSVPRS